MSTHETLAELFYLFSIARHCPDDTVRRECERIASTLPVHVIPPDADDSNVYLKRYGVADLGDGGHVYLHHVMRGDGAIELHSHPWPARAMILAGGYREERRFQLAHDSTRYRVGVDNYYPGDTNFINASTFHRIDLFGDVSAWTILITGPKIARVEGEPSWSFWDRNTGLTTGYRDFLAAKGIDAVSTPHNLATGVRAV